MYVGRGVSLLLSLLLFIPQAMAIAPSSVTGDTSGNLKVLSKADGKALRLYTDSKGLQSVFSFPVNTLGKNPVLEMVFKQKKAANKYSIEVLTSAGYIKLANLNSSKYKSYTLSLHQAALNAGTLKVRIVAARDSDDASLDFLNLNNDGAITPTPTPIPHPPAPAPVPSARGPVVMNGKVPAGMTWYWQLQGAVKNNIAATIYDIDLFDNTANTFAQLKSQGKMVICYFSAGTYEDWREDAKQFPANSLGAGLPDWPGEKWLDIRNATVRQIIAARMDYAKAKGCDGLEPDNVDGYSNKNGLNLTAADQVNFNSYLADQAHARGLVIALKNSTDLVSQLVNKFDFAVVEQCYQYKECDAYLPFVAQNKAVLIAEYNKYNAASCSDSKNKKFSTVYFGLDLDGKIFQPCP